MDYKRLTFLYIIPLGYVSIKKIVESSQFVDFIDTDNTAPLQIYVPNTIFSAINMI